MFLSLLRMRVKVKVPYIKSKSMSLHYMHISALKTFKGTSKGKICKTQSSEIYYFECLHSCKINLFLSCKERGRGQTVMRRYLILRKNVFISGQPLSFWYGQCLFRVYGHLVWPVVHSTLPFQQYSSHLKFMPTSTVLNIDSDSTSIPPVFKCQSMILVVNSNGWLRSSLEQGRLVLVVLF